MKPPRRGWGGGAREAVAFVTSQYLRQAVSHDQSAAPRRSECNAFNCALFQWAVQVQAVATRVQRPHSPASVHIFSACFSSTLAETMSRCHERTRCPARVRVHSHHARELVQAVDAMQAHAQAHKPCCPEWEAQAVRMLLRWEVFAMTMAQVAVYLDLDTEILPLWSQMLVQRKEEYWPRGCNSTWDERLDEAAVQLVAQDWSHLISCAASETTNPYLMLSFPDHSSPVNGAVLIVRPNMSIYLEGIDVLRRATMFTPFNTSLGWEHVGRPSEVIPPTDHVWWRRRRHTHVVDENNWDFVGGRTDQGFFFYMLRVRHRLGGDLRMWSKAGKHAAAVEFNAAEVPVLWTGRSTLRREWRGDRAHNQLGKANPRAEVSDAMKCLEREEAAASLVAKVELSHLAATLDNGMSCLAAAAQLARHSYNITIPYWRDGPGTQLQDAVVPAEDLFSASSSTVLTRAIPLLTPASALGWGSAYVRSSRHSACLNASSCVAW
ncbi:hypothetical protein AB1Y20_015243 [Prymnesium parvum]|uniref:Protein xylosyltransferase n=1 Tax=Prymnesium parvum TaxID=97485 RepID=A0AB34JXV4_PRYPA